MRQTILGILAAVAVMAANAVPASACGGCWGCGYSTPCASTYVQPYVGCCAGYERLPDPEVQYHSAPAAAPQYYYVNQGPTYSGPGAFAPYRTYDQGGLHQHGYWHHRHYWHPHRYGHHPHVLHSYY